MLRYVAPASVILFAATLPFAASAASSGGALCSAAAADPAAFMQRTDLAEAFAVMSDTCPTLASELMATGSIPENLLPGADRKTRSFSTSAPDYSDLLDRLASATNRLDGATADVRTAQKALDRTIRRAKKLGLTEDTLRLVVAMDSDGGSEDLRRILPDFTAAKRAALENYVDARDNLKDAEARLAKLLSDADKALKEAADASEKARAATKDEEEDVATAKQALDLALKAAQEALAGSEEEAAALQAVLDAQDDLAAALKALGIAQAEAEAVAEEVADIPAAPEEVTEASDEMTAAMDGATSAEEDATATQQDAEDKVADYNDAQSDLNDAVGEPDSLAEATSEPSSDTLTN